MTLLAFVLAFGAAQASAAGHPGRAVFDAAGCRACHSIAGRGGNSGPDLTLVGFRRTREWLALWLKDPKAWKPDTKMPDFRLAGPERGAIVDYLSTLTGQDLGPLRQRWGHDGEAIYRFAGCVACHGAQGRGRHPNNNFHGGEIPAVFKVADGYTLDELKARIRSGRVPEAEDVSKPAPMVLMPAWGHVLEEEEIDSVARYLMSLAPVKKTEDF